MPDSARFAMHRPEILSALLRGEEKIRRIMAKDARTLPANRLLVVADTEHNYVYRIRQGWAGRIRTLPDGRGQFILIFLPGDLFGVKSMFVNKHPDAIETLSDMVLEQIDYRELRNAYEADADIAMRCTWQVVEEERRLHNWVVGLGRGSPEERLALLLSDFRGRLILSKTIAPDALEFEVPMTQTQLGDHLGISTVHMNRVLRVIREQGIATMRSGRIVIHDLEALARLADPLQDWYERTTPAFGGDPDNADYETEVS